MSRCFRKEIWMAKKHVKRCATSLTFREIQVKTTMSCPYKPIEQLKFKKNCNTKCQ